MTMVSCLSKRCKFFEVNQEEISSTEDKEIDKREMALLSSIDERRESLVVLELISAPSSRRQVAAPIVSVELPHVELCVHCMAQAC